MSVEAELKALHNRIFALERIIRGRGQLTMAGSSFEVDRSDRVSNLVRKNRLIDTVAPISGGGDLSADRELSFLYDETYLDINSDGQLDLDISAIATAVSPLLDHGTLLGRSDDDHTQYALLAGRATGQVLNGGAAASETLSLQSTANATKGLILLNDNLAITPDGGIASSYINKTGGASVRGAVMAASTTTSNAVENSGTSTDDPVGIVYNAGVADGSLVWVVHTGKAYILFDSSTTPLIDYHVWVSTATAARAGASSGISTARHWGELGHSLDSATGAGQLILCAIHFN